MNLRAIGDFSVRFRYLVIPLYVLVAVFFGSRIPNAQFDPDIKSMIPEGFGANQRYEAITERFGGTDFVMVGFETDDVLDSDTLRRIDDVTYQLSLTDGVEKVVSITTLNDIRGEAGTMVVEPLVPFIPETAAETEEIRQRIAGNSLMAQNIVSEDFTATAILAFVTEESEDAELMEAVYSTLEEFPGDETVHVGGLPAVRSAASKGMRTDLITFLPGGIVVMVLFLFLSFRQLRGVLIPFLIVVFSIMVAMGSIVLLGWQIQLVTVILPVVLIAIANDYGIHLVAHYQDQVDREPSITSSEASGRIVGLLGAPVIAAGITTMVGFASLSSHLVVSAQQLGVLASIGILYALIGSLSFLPAVMSLLPARGRAKLSGASYMIDRLLGGLGVLVTRWPRRVLVGSIATFGVISLGMTLLVIDTNPINFFSPRSDVRQADHFLQENFGGTTNLAIVVEGDILDPRTMRMIDRVTTDLESREYVGEVTSIAEIVRHMNQVLHDGEEQYDSIPDTREAIAQYFLLYSFGGDPADFEKMVDFNYEHALITARLKTTATQQIRRELDFAREIKAEVNSRGDAEAVGDQTGADDSSERDSTDTTDAPSVTQSLPAQITAIGGFSDILTELATILVWGQLRSLGIAVALIGLVVALLFRGIKSGVMVMVPLALAITTLLGLMGLFGIEMNTVTAMLTSILIGVGVDYTIHYLAAYRRSKTAGDTPVRAVVSALNGSGRAIIFNALSVMVGFAVLFLSGFLPIRFFGFLVVVSIASCLYTALVLLPSIILSFRRTA